MTLPEVYLTGERIEGLRDAGEVLPTPNLPLLRKVRDHIEANKPLWNQAKWLDTATVALETGENWCGTVACVAGHTCLIVGDTPEVLTQERAEEAFTNPGVTSNVIPSTPTNVRPSFLSYYSGQDSVPVSERARELLGLTRNEAESLFEGGNEWEDVLMWMRVIADRAGEEL